MEKRMTYDCGISWMEITLQVENRERCALVSILGHRGEIEREKQAEVEGFAQLCISAMLLGKQSFKTS